MSVCSILEFDISRFLLGNKRPASRWDTPSPSSEVTSRGPPITARIGGAGGDSMSRGSPITLRMGGAGSESMSRGPPITARMGGAGGDSGDDDDNALPVAFGRGRGKRRKKNKGKNKGKNSK